ncbi:MAG: hypothetical protein ACE5IJ_07305 [Thermoplasmata archaeon]
MTASKTAILVASLALGITLTSYLLALSYVLPYPAILLAYVTLPFGMTLAFIGLLVAFFTQKSG